MISTGSDAVQRNNAPSEDISVLLNHLRLVGQHLPSVKRGVIALFSSLRAEDPSRLSRHRQ